jgi:hypothetical protein
VIGCVSLSYSDRLFQNARLRGPVLAQEIFRRHTDLVEPLSGTRRTST